MKRVWNADAKIKAYCFAGGPGCCICPSGWSAPDLVFESWQAARFWQGTDASRISMFLHWSAPAMLWSVGTGLTPARGGCDGVSATPFYDHHPRHGVASPFVWPMADGITRCKPSLVGVLLPALWPFGCYHTRCGFVTSVRRDHHESQPVWCPLVACRKIKAWFV